MVPTRGGNTPSRSCSIACLLVAVALSCAAGPSKATSSNPAPAPSPSPAPTASPDDGDRADPCDMCVLQGDPDADAEGEDGCPGPDFQLTATCGVPPQEAGRIVRAAKEVGANSHLTRVRIVSGRVDCANAVRAEFERAGLPASRLEVSTRSGAPSVSLEVGAWDGRPCVAETPRQR